MILSSLFYTPTPLVHLSIVAVLMHRTDKIFTRNVKSDTFNGMSLPVLVPGIRVLCTRMNSRKKCLWLVAQIVAEAKTGAWEKFGEAMEKDFHPTLKRF